MMIKKKKIKTKKSKILNQVQDDRKKWTKEEEQALEHLIEETLAKAYNSKDIQDEAEGHGHFEIDEIPDRVRDDRKLKSKEEKFSEFKKLAEETNAPEGSRLGGRDDRLKIPGVRKADGSACCGGACCDTGTVTTFKPHLTKAQYFDLINSVLDPETGIGIADMGLIYNVEEFPGGLVEVTMTLTSMGCPAGGQITTEIDSWLKLQNHVKDVKINVVWEPAWNPDMMNPDIKAMMFGN